MDFSFSHQSDSPYLMGGTFYSSCGIDTYDRGFFGTVDVHTLQCGWWTDWSVFGWLHEKLS